MTQVASNDMMSLHVVPVKDRYAREGGVVAHAAFQPDPRAGFAMQIIERFALIAATPDGEDSAGRQAMRLREPAEIASFASRVADAAFKEFQERGWLLAMPAYEALAGDQP
jgi:hypothetical protein